MKEAWNMVKHEFWLGLILGTLFSSAGWYVVAFKMLFACRGQNLNGY